MWFVILILGYPFSYFLFRAVSKSDEKNELWSQLKDIDWREWYEYREGRKKIYFIFLCIPYVNILASLVVFIWYFSELLFKKINLPNKIDKMF